MNIAIERRQSSGGALTVAADDGSDALPPELAANLGEHLQSLRTALADLAERSDKCGTWLQDDENLVRYLRRCGEVDSAIDALRGDLTRRFRIPSCWD